MKRSGIKRKLVSIGRAAKKFLCTFFQDRLAAAGLITLIIFILISIVAPRLAPYDPLAQNVRLRLEPPGKEHVLGTDSYGRDVLSRLIWGSRATLLVGICSIAFSATLGTAIGAVSAYLGGLADQSISQIVDILMSFPSFLLGLIVSIALGPGLVNVIIAISISMLPRFIRIARGSTLTIREREYVAAAVSLGIPFHRIVFFHIIPNLLGPIIITSTLWIATAVRIEASLSFLGLGVQPPTPSWGNMVRDGMNNILNIPSLALFPSTAITLFILALNMVGDGLRDMFDPRAKEG